MDIGNSIEIEKIRPYWRAKGFTRPETSPPRWSGTTARLYRYRSWQMIEMERRKR
jgi:hypothetical protein